MPQVKSCSIFSKDEMRALVLSLFCIAVVLPVIFPMFAKMSIKSNRNYCVANKRMIGIAVSIYVLDYDDQLPFAGHSDLYNSAHRVNFAEIILPYLRNRSAFQCSSIVNLGSSDTKYNDFSPPVANTGTAYFCGHASLNGEKSDFDSPFRKILLHNGPNGEGNPKGETIFKEVEQYFACGHKMSEVIDPKAAPLIMCNGFVHSVERRKSFEWELDFLPKSLGGSGRMTEAGTIVAYADGHVKIEKAKYGPMMEKLGLTKPFYRPRAIASQTPNSIGP